VFCQLSVPFFVLRMVLSPDDPVDGIDEDVQLFTGFGLSGPQFFHLRYPVFTVFALHIADLLKRIKAGPGDHDEAADRVVLFVDFLSAFDGLLLLLFQLLLVSGLLLVQPGLLLLQPSLLFGSPFKNGFDLVESFFWSHSDPRYSGLLYLFHIPLPSALPCPDPKPIISSRWENPSTDSPQFCR
jgi:hypothetical protein